jgi:hypothetical protein
MFPSNIEHDYETTIIELFSTWHDPPHAPYGEHRPQYRGGWGGVGLFVWAESHGSVCVGHLHAIA